MRSPVLHDTLQRFCLGAFAVFVGELDSGGSLPFSFEEHGSPGKPSLYEYRPLVRGFIEARADRLFQRDDVRSAVADLQREPAARIFARAHEGLSPDEPRALYRSVLVPLLVRTAESCGGFDWDDAAFDRAYTELEGSLFGDGHAYGAVAPLIGVSCGSVIERGDGIRVRAAGADEAPDAPGELADAVTALRLCTAAPVAAGPVLFERLDWRPYGIRPVLPIAATAPPGEPTRLDPFRATVAAQLRPQLARADDDPQLGEALDRWELSLFQTEPFRAEQLRHALDSALGDGNGAWAAGMRGAALLGDTPEERADLAERFQEPTPDLMRRLLLELLLHGDRRRLVRELDDALLALRPRPARVAELRAS